MRCRNIEEVMAFIEQVFDDNVRKLETDVTLSFEARGDYPDPDDMDAMLDEQRAQKQVWLEDAREAHHAALVRQLTAGLRSQGTAARGPSLRSAAGPDFRVWYPWKNRAENGVLEPSCGHCGGTFTPTRPHQKHCKPSCRMAAFRARTERAAVAGSARARASSCAV